MPGDVHGPPFDEDGKQLHADIRAVVWRRLDPIKVGEGGNVTGAALPDRGSDWDCDSVETSSSLLGEGTTHSDCEESRRVHLVGV